MRIIVGSIAILVVLLLVKSVELHAQGGPPVPVPPGFPTSPPPPPPASAEELYRPKLKAQPVERVSGDHYRMGDIEMYKNTGSLSFPAQVNMDRGLLEYLLVRTGGKTHESLLRTAVEPYNLQLAFLLLGYEPTERPLKRQGDPEKPQGVPVEISITFKDKEGRPREIGAEEWIATKKEEKMGSTGKINWVFTGSRVINGRFLAQSEGSIIATYHDPVAMIDNASAGGESNRIWFVQEGVVPAPGTAVTVTIRKAAGP